MKIVSVIGARPQFVKAAVVSQAIKKHNESGKRPKIEEFVVHTGQHYDEKMSGIFIRDLAIDVTINLGISEKTHARMTAAMLTGIEDVLCEHRPDVIMVYGDTNSTLAASLAASKLNIPIAHVEAGLRSFNMQMPEEINRILTDRISTWLFCPTETSVGNLKNEGIGSKKFKKWNQGFPQHVYQVGDVMYDAFKVYLKNACCSSQLSTLLAEVKDGFYLATVHRSENTDDPARLKNIWEALEIISEKKKVILPIHPRTLKAIDHFGIDTQHIRVISPVNYFDMLILLKNCMAVFTDSGGLQKESYYMGKPCITLRNETEWLELIQYGANILAGSEKQAIINAEISISNQNFCREKRLYGNGDAGNKIVKYLSQHFAVQ